jgi:hypothetical protein
MRIDNRHVLFFLALLGAIGFLIPDELKWSAAWGVLILLFLIIPWRAYKLPSNDAGQAFLLFKQLLMHYCTNRSFEAAVHDATTFSAVKPTEEKSFLSILYVLEEIALLLRAKAKFKLYDEFYLGPPFETFTSFFRTESQEFLQMIGYWNSFDKQRARFFYWDDLGWKEY